MTQENSIGPYRLLTPLGKGGMGVVWRAEHKETHQQVALKTILVPKKGLLRSIRREIQALAKLRHPGIVRIVEEGVHQGLPYYAMELLEGQTLPIWRSRLTPLLSEEPTRHSHQDTEVTQQTLLPLLETTARMEPVTFVGRVMPSEEVPLPPILTLIRRLCASLSFLHSEGVVHRDLKPENVLVLPGNLPVLVDFGIASAQGISGRERMTLGDRSQQGTIAYMSLEQIHGEPLDARADLYSLGVVLFELLTGRKPFDGDSPQAILWARFSEEAPRPSQFAANIPPELDNLVLRLLARDRNDRPGYAEDVAQALIALGAEKDSGEDLRPKTYLYRPSFAGRIQELEQLHKLATRTKFERGGLVFVSGESGVGKTRLLLELARDLSSKGTTVLLGECRDKEDDVPLNALQKPLQEISDRCVERGKGETERLLGRRGKIVAPYELSISNLPGQEMHPEPPELPPEQAKERLYQALTEIFLALSAEQPLVLLLDDLQWADELSLGFLRFFLKREDLSRWLLVIGAYRAEEAKPPLKKLFSSEGVESLSLGRLSEEAVAKMVGDMLALSPPPKRLSSYLAEHSSGNPFFVSEYLRAAVDEKLLRRDSEGRWQVVGLQDDSGENISGRWQITGAGEADYNRLELPRTLKALVERRLSGLSKSARTALEAFSVVGRVADVDLLAWVTPLTEDAFEEALDELSRRQIVEEAGPGRIRFIHEKIREIGYERLTPKARTGLHRATAEAIEGLYEEREEHLAALALHWEQAGALEKARQYYLRSARRATQVYSHTEAERLYSAYLRLSTSPTQESIVARNELAEKVLSPQGRFPQAEEALLRSLEEARAAGLKDEEADSLRHIGQLKWWQGALEEAERFFEEALALSKERGDTRREGILLNSVANLYLVRGQHQSAQSIYENALEAHRSVGNRRLEGVTLTNLATLHFHQGQGEKSLPLFEMAVGISAELNDPKLEASALVNLAALCTVRGELEKAHQLFLKELTIFRELGDRRLEAISLAELADLERWRSLELEPVEQLIQQSEAMLRDVGDKLALAKLLRVKGHLAIFHQVGALPEIEEIERLANELGAGPESDLRKRLETLQRAQKAFEEHREKEMYRGQLLEDIPMMIKRWLDNADRLPTAETNRE